MDRRHAWMQSLSSSASNRPVARCLIGSRNNPRPGGWPSGAGGMDPEPGASRLAAVNRSARSGAGASEAARRFHLAQRTGVGARLVNE